jgi:histidine ammonia-lyase
MISKEINAATDNPLIISKETIISGGNFHGEPVGFAADFLGIAITELGAISERRTFRLLDNNLNNNLTGMLVGSTKDEGLNSGVMMLQYTAAALALENQTYATPDSIKSLPTSANQEDHNANAFNAAMNLWRIIKNTQKIIAIELYVATRGFDLRKKTSPKGKMGSGTQKAYDAIRDIIPFQANDAEWGKELNLLYDLIINGSDLKGLLLKIAN